VKFMKGYFANGVLCAFAPDVVSLGPWHVGKISSQNWKKRKKTSFAQKSLMCLLNFVKMEETWM